MNKNQGLAYITGLIVVIALLHFVALYFHLYWSLWWFDIVMHFLGGVWVGAFTLWYFFRVSQSAYGKMRVIGTVVLAALFVGVLWEIYEYLFGISVVGKEAYLFDTMLDLIMDVLGALTVGALFVPRKYTSL